LIPVPAPKEEEKEKEKTRRRHPSQQKIDAYVKSAADSWDATEELGDDEDEEFRGHVTRLLQERKTEPDAEVRNRSAEVPHGANGWFRWHGRLLTDAEVRNSMVGWEIVGSAGRHMRGKHVKPDDIGRIFELGYPVRPDSDSEKLTSDYETVGGHQCLVSTPRIWPLFP
jgi:hypothetical protein